MSALLRWPSWPCHSDNTKISTKNRLCSLSVIYSGYSDYTFGRRESRRCPLWSAHSPNEKPTWMLASSSCPTEIHVNSGKCRTLWSTRVEPLGRLKSIVLMSKTTQCWQLPTRIKSAFWTEYCRNCDRWGVTWKEAPKSRSQLVASSVAYKTSYSTIFSITNIFGS